MKQIVILSGKGGTGKTIISASFASLAQNKVMVDCDVDTANLHLLLHPEIQESHSFSAGMRAFIIQDKCSGCGECLEVCRFSAIRESQNREITIDLISCEGCSVCFLVCPVEAVEMEKTISGEWFVSRTKHGPFVHARLGIGEENSGKLVAQVRKKAKEIAEENNLDLVILDGPPGIGCPVIASLSGTDMALIVTEPTLAGIHDMERVAQTALHFKIPMACCINKYDINPDNSAKIEEWCLKNSVPLVGKVPFDEDVTHSMVNLIPLPEYSNNAASKEIKAIWRNIKKLL
ncbi:MAG: ATP-binding protein [Candidatus Aminicenantes bacterium]|jgi:MinD superfamily P-loop ATPase